MHGARHFASRADDVDDLGRVGNEIAPAIGNSHRRQVLQDIEAHAFEQRHTRGFQRSQVAQLRGRAFHAIARGHKNLRSLGDFLACEQFGQRLQLE